MSGAEELQYVYRFTLGAGEQREVKVRLNAATLTPLEEPSAPPPVWAKLSHHQCPNCPLKEAEHPHCPVAVQLADVVASFRESLSVDRTNVTVVTEARTYTKSTSMAEGLSSVIGLIMVTSGCPILDRLKPMARTHLPFSTWQETVYRAVSAYLLAQHFRERRGEEPDWGLTGLGRLSRDLKKVNESFCRRLRGTGIQDAALNAVVQLDCFASMTEDRLRQKRLGALEPLFRAYFDRPDRR